ncbi:MAG: hypothetical protein IIV91_04060, partial [Alistipes sp.]|nr:hypothetical protein [Alistipes sp.]
ARGFVAGDKMAVVVANQQREPQTLTAKIEVPGYRYVEHTALRTGTVAKGGRRVTLRQYDLALLLFEKE